MLRSRPYVTRLSCQLSIAIAVFSLFVVTGCGVVQALRGSTHNDPKSPPAPQAQTMTIDLSSQPFLNPDPDGQSLSVLIRFYQLGDIKTFAELNYVQLQRDDQKLLGDHLLAMKDVVLRPGVSTSVTEPVNVATQVVGVVAFFREPGDGQTWKLTIPRERWKEPGPVTIEVEGNELRLLEADPQAK